MSGIPPLPNAEANCQEPRPAHPFPPFGSGCGGCSPAFGPPGDRLDSHVLYQHISVVAPPQKVPAAPPLRLPEYRPTASCHGGLPQRLPPPGECPYLRSTGSVWCPSCHGPWDWPQSPSPQRCLGHGSINALPGPLQTYKVVVNRQSLRPEPFKNSSFDPLGEVVVDGAGQAEGLPGQGLPMDSSAQQIKDAFGNAPEVHAAESTPFAPAGWYQGFYVLPNWVGQFPRGLFALTLVIMDILFSGGMSFFTILANF
jgi:hypothetical protein